MAPSWLFPVSFCWLCVLEVGWLFLALSCLFSAVGRTSMLDGSSRLRFVASLLAALSLMLLDPGGRGIPSSRFFFVSQVLTSLLAALSLTRLRFCWRLLLWIFQWCRFAVVIFSGVVGCPLLTGFGQYFFSEIWEISYFVIFFCCFLSIFF